MQNEHNHNRTQGAAPLPVWSAPQLIVVDAALTQATANNLGGDGGFYS